MSHYIEAIKQALEFKKPGYLPMEILDVPGIYNNNHTLDPDSVTMIPGTENFDSMWTNCYSWFHRLIEKNSIGEEIRQDQFGTIIKIPNSENYTYEILESPLFGKNNIKNYSFPRTDDLRDEFNKLNKVIQGKYIDRFINGFIDPGIFISTQLLLGTQNFFLQIADNINFVIEVYKGLADYYKGIALNYKKAGVHMITDIESLGSNKGLVIHPDTWRKYFKPILKDFFSFIHDLGLYTSLCIDGDAKEVLEDLFDMEIDLVFFVDINTTGIEIIKEKIKGKICIKSTVDMQDTLGNKSPEEVKIEANRIVDSLNASNGGLICEVLRWNKPEFPPENVKASVEAFNYYRKF